MGACVLHVRHGRAEDMASMCNGCQCTLTSKAIALPFFPSTSLSIETGLPALSVLSFEHFFFLFFVSLITEECQARIREDGRSLRCFQLSNKWYVHSHFQIESRLSKCQLESGYMTSLAVWFQQLADLFIASPVGLYCTGEFLMRYIASNLHSNYCIRGMGQNLK